MFCAPEPIAEKESLTGFRDTKIHYVLDNCLEKFCSKYRMEFFYEKQCIVNLLKTCHNGDMSNSEFERKIKEYICYLLTTAGFKLKFLGFNLKVLFRMIQNVIK